jgi:hypothetical protein
LHTRGQDTEEAYQDLLGICCGDRDPDEPLPEGIPTLEEWKLYNFRGLTKGYKTMMGGIDCWAMLLLPQSFLSTDKRHVDSVRLVIATAL